MVVMGNGSSFLGRYLESFFNPVANTIGLNTTWNFFSPDPAHTMYIKYDIYFEDEYGHQLKEPIMGFYPPSRDLGGDLTMNKKRDAYAMRFLVIDQERIPKFFVPWMCAKNPEASKIFIEVILNRIPTLDQMLAVVNQNLQSYENIVSTEEIGRSAYECPRAG